IVDKDTITTVGPPSKSYSFHSVFREHASNELCNTIIDQMLHNVIMGFNAVLFAYGQTVSGKTFSIIGNQQQTEIGMLPHMLRSALDKPGISRVSLSAVEVLGQIVTSIEFFDLLDQRNQNSDWSKKIGSTTINIDKLNQTVIQNPEDAYTIVQTARQASQVAPTGKNPDSSRGRVVFLSQLQPPAQTNVQNQQSPSSWWIAPEVRETVHSAMTSLIQPTRKYYIVEDGKQDASIQVCRNYKSCSRTA
ncbi:hypothetical protein RFI_38647, partial [Reticulomyxa filosa]